MSANPMPTEREQERRDRCMNYLLGEMTAEQASAFESQLDDPAVASALASESELLLGVASCASARPAVAPQTNSWRSDASESPSLKSLVLVAGALAAVVFIAFALTSPGSVDQQNGDYELELAKTWVRPAVNWWPQDTAGITDGSDPLGLDSIDEPAGEDDFQWMVAAVQASLEEKRDDS